jgi:hypothetical protein
MKFISAVVLPSVFLSILFLADLSGTSRAASKDASAAPLFGFRNSADEIALETRRPPITLPKNSATPVSRPKSSNTASG